ncbi:hypothetical protein N1851_034018 [Merluccius polli]|uniref:Uncharacterized protein n=1 Tax=Merluccius polli TaxID=89951 RepID=A0AA47NN20_MERPO|nr:hypothetical protein N1851_034018 [Merluccius polli]
MNEIGRAWYTLKRPYWKGECSVVIRFFNEDTLAITEQLLEMTTSDSGDAQTITNVVCSELTNAGLTTSRILSQVYDGAAVITEEFSNCCNTLYNFFRKPTIALNYSGEKLKRLLDQRWTGHLATDIAVLKEVSTAMTYGDETHMEVTGLLLEVSDQSPLFIAQLVHKANKLLAECVVEETTGGNTMDKVELSRLYFSVLDRVLVEMERRFSKCNSKLAAALVALDPESDTFLDVKALQPL